MKFLGSSFLALVLVTSSLNSTQVQATREPFQIGEHFSIIISSKKEESQITPVSRGNINVYTLVHTEASFMSVHFKNMDIDPSCSIQIQDESGGQMYAMKGRGRGGLGTFWARHVKGDTINIVVRCHGINKEATFEIDDYVAGYNEAPRQVGEFGDGYGKPPRALKRNLRSYRKDPHSSPFKDASSANRGRELAICGVDDKLNAKCYEGTAENGAMYTKARAVARLYINGSGACTGWLVGPNNMLMTNEHCIGSAADVNSNTDFEFMGEEDSCNIQDNNWMAARGTIYDGTALLAVNDAKDYALVQLEGNPASEYG